MMSGNVQQNPKHIFDCLYVGYGIHIKSWEIIILFSMCRYAQSCAFISVIELPRIPAYCPKKNQARFDFDLRFPKMSSYLRRAAIQHALGSVSSYKARLKL